MFTGIREELGQVYRIQRIGRNTLLEISSDKIYKDTVIGDSIAVNGTCLTITKRINSILGFEIMPQTLRATNLLNLRIKDKVNLERSLRAGDRISGHFVYGHIDSVGLIRRKIYSRNNLCFDIAVPPKVISQIRLNGSVAVDGISLTVQNKKSNLISVYIIPHTFKNTTLGFKRPSDRVNIETDKLAISPFTNTPQAFSSHS